MVCELRKRARFVLLAASFVALGGCSIFGEQSASSASPQPTATSATPEPANTTPPAALPNNARPGWLQGVFGAPLAVQEDPSQPKPAPGTVAVSCPNVTVRNGTETLRTFRAGAGEAAEALVWQASIGKLARECHSLGPNDNFAALYIVGATGRILLGPSGAPGNYQVPVRIAIVRDEKVLDSRLTQVGVVIPPNETQATFTIVVDNFKIARDPSDNLADVQILVGFDPAPPPPPAKTAQRKRGKQS